MEIYLQQNAERSGPYTLENLQAWLEEGQLSVSDAAWFEGCSDWVKVQGVPGVMLPGGDHLVNASTVPPFEAYHGDEPYVFISYAHKDAAVVYEEIGVFTRLALKYGTTKASRPAMNGPKKSPGRSSIVRYSSLSSHPVRRTR